MVRERTRNWTEPSPRTSRAVQVASIHRADAEGPLTGSDPSLVQGARRLRLSASSPRSRYLIRRPSKMQHRGEEPVAALTATSANLERSVSLPRASSSRHERRRPLRARAPDRSTLRTIPAEKQEDPRGVNVAVPLHQLSESSARRLRVIQARHPGSPSPGPGGIDKGRAEYSSASSARSRPSSGGDGGRGVASSAERSRRPLAGAAREAADRELRPARAAAAAAAEYESHPHLHRLAPQPAVNEAHRGRPRRRRRPRGPRRRPLRPRADQGPEFPRPQAPPESSGPILCFVRPPGVGESRPRRARSIARRSGAAWSGLGEKHPARTRSAATVRAYVGAMPGTIVRRSATPAPATRLHDRRDRQDGRRLRHETPPRDARGPRSRPERLVHDHYLDLDFDLSNVLTGQRPRHGLRRHSTTGWE